jgi:hypothetical protein
MAGQHPYAPPSASANASANARATIACTATVFSERICQPE